MVVGAGRKELAQLLSALCLALADTVIPLLLSMAALTRCRLI